MKKKKKYCMPDNINTKEEHEQYMKDIGYYNINPKQLFNVYKNGGNWGNVCKTHENLFVIGGESIMMRTGKLLHEFFNHKSDANKCLDAVEQENLEKEFGDWCVLNMLSTQKR